MYHGKNLSVQSREPTNPHMSPSLGIEPEPHWLEASTLTTAPPLLFAVNVSAHNQDSGLSKTFKLIVSTSEKILNNVIVRFNL